MIILIRLAGLQLFTSLMDSLIEVKLRHICCRTTEIFKETTEKTNPGREQQRTPRSLCNVITATLTLQGRSSWESCDSAVTSTASRVSKLNMFCPICHADCGSARVPLPVCQKSHLRWHRAYCVCAIKSSFWLPNHNTHTGDISLLPQLPNTNTNPLPNAAWCHAITVDICAADSDIRNYFIDSSAST